MESVKRTVSKHRIVIVYIFFFTVLASIAVWDVKEIIVDYIEDNRLTQVTARNSQKDGYPFLDNPLICLTYDHPLVPGLNWDEYFIMLNDSWHQRKIVWPKNLSESQKSILANLFALIKYTIVKRMDNRLVRIASDNYVLSGITDALLINKTEAIILVDKFIQNADSVELNENALLRRIVQLDLEKTPKNVTFEKIKHTRYQSGAGKLEICVILPVVNDLKTAVHSRYYHYFLDMISIEIDNRSILRSATSIADVEIKFCDDVHKIKSVSSIQTGVTEYKISDRLYYINTTSAIQRTGIVIQISNGEVLDRQRFPPCTKDFRREDDCLKHLRQSIIKKYCYRDCTQLSKDFAKRNGGSKKSDQKPFCTWRAHERCSYEVHEEYQRQKILTIAKHACKPCFSATNFLKIWTDTRYGGPTEAGEWYSGYQLRFELAKDTYLLFEEKPQFNFSQLVSQIGGDLGLYIGFSMISILQLILYFYHMHRQRRTTVRVNRKWGDWFRFYLHYIARSFKNIDSGDDAENLQRLDERMQNQDRQLQNCLKEVNDLKSGSSRVLIKLEEMMERIRKIECKTTRQYNKLASKIEQLANNRAREINSVSLSNNYKIRCTHVDHESKC